MATIRQVQGALNEPRLIEEKGLAARVAHLAEPVLAHLGYRLVRVKLSALAGMTVQVMAERPDGCMTIGDCEIASEALSPTLDAEGLITSPYRLEISSPGIDRPLVRVSDFCQAIGREARIEMNSLAGGRRRFRGQVIAIEGEGDDLRLVLERSDAKAGEHPGASLPLREIAEARLTLSETLLRQSLQAGKMPRSGHARGEEESAAGAPEARAASPLRCGRIARAASGSKPVPFATSGSGLSQSQPERAAPAARATRCSHTTGDKNGRKRK
ncbi:MAG: ribosome maturation factor RimP [Methylocapsa sp.]|nr:ribosome maturation factor RimP [Methylocapsa sp.]